MVYNINMAKVNKKILLLGILFVILSGLIATPSSINPMSETYDAWYEPDTGRIHCSDKWLCLHESVHKYDWEYKDKQISTTKEFRKAVSEYLSNNTEHFDEGGIPTFIYYFPGVGNDYTENGWGGFHELFAELFRYTEENDSVELPEEFEQFYDREYIYNIWERYPNFWSRL